MALIKAVHSCLELMNNDDYKWVKSRVWYGNEQVVTVLVKINVTAQMKSILRSMNHTWKQQDTMTPHRLISFLTLCIVLSISVSNGQSVFDQEIHKTTGQSINRIMNWLWQPVPNIEDKQGVVFKKTPKMVFNPEKLKNLRNDQNMSPQCLKDIQLLIGGINKDQTDDSKWAKQSK